MRSSIFVIAGAALLVTACGDDGSPADPLDARVQELFPRDPSFGVVDRAQVRRMLDVAPDDDRPFYLAGFVRHRQRARYEDGRTTNLTGAEAAALYRAEVAAILEDIGARRLFVADTETALIDGDAAGWDQVGVVEYPSRARFFEMIERDDFRAAAVHEEAGVERAIMLVAGLDGNPFPEEFRKVDLRDLPFPPSPGDPPIAIVHLVAYNDVARYADGRATDLTGREAMQLYEQGRNRQNVLGLGVRPGLWLRIEGELVGDGRSWDEFRINNFPSRATFAALTTPESLKEAGIEHRVAALRDSYSLETAPILNQVGYR